MAKAKKDDIKSEVAAIERRMAARRAKERKAPKKQFTSWSYTRYADYKQCPLKAKLKHLDRIEEPPNDAMARGADIGRLAELFIKGSIKKLPHELRHFKKTFAEARAAFAKTPHRVVVEDQWALRKDYTRTVWNDWDGCWLRVKVDYGSLKGPKVMVVRDWKTGKYRKESVEEYVEQLELYALAALALNEQLERVEAFLCFLDPGVMYPEPDSPDAGRLVWTRADLPKLKKLWDKRTRAMLLDKAFVARPNGRCPWCFYRKDNAAALPGGKALCKY